MPVQKIVESEGGRGPNLKAALDGLKDIPTDINPSPVTADSLAPLHPPR